jgi:hypothetical protein
MLSGATWKLKIVVRVRQLGLRFHQPRAESPLLIVGDFRHGEQVLDIRDESLQPENFLDDASATMVHRQYVGWHKKIACMKHRGRHR